MAEGIELKYILSYSTKFGAVSAESSKPEDLVQAYPHLRALAQKLESRKTQTKKERPVRRKESDRKGRGETARILREIETKLLNTSFFSKPRTTGETRDKLLAVSRHSFTSRKVSQALGIFWQKRTLRRVGNRNHYAYSK